MSSVVHKYQTRPGDHLQDYLCRKLTQLPLTGDEKTTMYNSEVTCPDCVKILREEMRRVRAAEEEARIRVSELGSMTVEEVARRYFHPDRATIYVVVPRSPGQGGMRVARGREEAELHAIGLLRSLFAAYGRAEVEIHVADEDGRTSLAARARTADGANAANAKTSVAFEWI